MSDLPIRSEAGPAPGFKDFAKQTPPSPGPAESSVPAESMIPGNTARARDMLKAIAQGPEIKAGPEVKAGPATPEENAGPATPAGPATQEIKAGPEVKAGPATQEINAGPETSGKPEETGLNKPDQTAERSADKDTLDRLFTQSAALLLDKKDPRVVTVALARASGETPLGEELRRDTAHMLMKMDIAHLEPAQREQMSAIQSDLRILTIPETDAARSEFANVLTAYAAGNPDRGITPALIEQVRTNALSRPDGISNLMKADSTLTARLMSELNADPKEPFPNVATPEGLVKAAGIPMTPEHMTNAIEILRPKYAAPPKETMKLADMILPTALATSMTLMFVASLAGVGSERGH